MKVVYEPVRGEDSGVIEITNFEEGREGIALYGGPNADQPVGYMPFERLDYIIP